MESCAAELEGAPELETQIINGAGFIGTDGASENLLVATSFCAL